MAKISSFDLSASKLIDLAIEKHRKGDIMGAARYARDAIGVNKRNGLAYGVLACLFSDTNELELANKTLFKGIHVSGEYENKHYRRQLAINYLQLDLPDVAMYYSDEQDVDVLETLDAYFEDEEEAPEPLPELYLTYPPSREYCEHLLAKAFELVHEGDMKGALQIVESLPDDGSDIGTRSKLMLYTLGHDIDAVIDYGERMIKEGKDTVSVRCTLASAYLMKERNEDAYEAARPLLDASNDNIESMFMVLPVAVSLDMHATVVRIIKTIFERNNFRSTRRLLVWYAQALYNIGQPEAARAVMSDANLFFGEDAPAFYYLEMFAEQPEKVEYSLTLPREGNVRNMKRLREILLSADDELTRFDRSHQAVGDNLEYYVHWALTNGPEKMQSAVINRLLYYKRAKEIFESSLISGELDCGIMSEILDALEFLNDGLRPLEFDIVCHERFKHISFVLPRALQSLPSVFKRAVQLSIADIVFTDEEPNIYLERLTRLINSIADISGDGKVVYSSKLREKLSSVRNADALVGVFMSKVYEEDETKDSLIERYAINPKLYDKYFNIVFGDSND